jgi:hypothetical protein
MSRRVGSDSAAKVRSSVEYLTIWLTLAARAGVRNRADGATMGWHSEPTEGRA